MPSCEDAAQPLRPPASLPFPSLPLLPIPMPSSPCPQLCQAWSLKAQQGPPPTEGAGMCMGEGRAPTFR